MLPTKTYFSFKDTQSLKGMEKDASCKFLKSRGSHTLIGQNKLSQRL